MSSGKKFERLIKLSAEAQGLDYTRFKDAGYMRAEKGEHKRFTPKNICDCIIFTGYKLYYMEAKAGKTAVAFNRLTQHDDLLKKVGVNNVHAGYLMQINDRCFFAGVTLVDNIIRLIGKKSVNDNDLTEYGALEIPKYFPPRKRTHRLDFSVL